MGFSKSLAGPPLGPHALLKGFLRLITHENLGIGKPRG